MCRSNGIKSYDETVRFDAETHLDFYRDVFAMMSMSFDDWVLCIVGYNSSVNQKLANISRNPLVGCLSHHLNLDVSTVLKGDPEIAGTVAYVLRTIKCARKTKECCIIEERY